MKTGSADGCLASRPASIDDVRLHRPPAPRSRSSTGSSGSPATARALLVLLVLAGILGSMMYGGWPAFREFGFGFLTSSVWDVEQRAVRRLGGDRRHADLRLHRPRHRRAGLARHRHLPDPALPAPGSSGRSRPRSSFSPPCRASSTACGACSSSRRCSRPTCRSRSPTLVEGLPIVGTILYARVPSGVGILTAGIILAFMIIPFIASITRDILDQIPTDAARERLRHRLHDLGGRPPRARAAGRASASSARSCWGSAARSARPWR